MTTVRLGWLLSLLALFGAGCTAQRNARGLARETLAQVVEYEESVRTLQRTMQKYYDRTWEQLKDRVRIQHDNTIGAVENRMADDAVSVAMDRGFRSQDLREFIRGVLAEERAGRLRTTEALLELESKKSSILQRADTKEARLRALRVKLETLQQEPGYEDQIARYKDVYEMWRGAWDESRNKN